MRQVRICNKARLKKCKFWRDLGKHREGAAKARRCWAAFPSACQPPCTATSKHCQCQSRWGCCQGVSLPQVSLLSYGVSTPIVGRRCPLTSMFNWSPLPSPARVAKGGIIPSANKAAPQQQTAEDESCFVVMLYRQCSLQFQAIFLLHLHFLVKNVNSHWTLIWAAPLGA